jgi:hypothetical protein
MLQENLDDIYTSVVTLALGLVTLTPSCFARAMMSMRFLEETAEAILLWSVSETGLPSCIGEYQVGG